jgi:hypothetical protein
VWHEERSHRLNFFLSGNNRDKIFVPEHVRTLHNATNALCCLASAERSAPTFWKYYPKTKKKKNSVALARKRTMPTERPPLVGEVSANFRDIEGVAWSKQRIPTAVDLAFLDTESLLVHSSSSSLILTSQSGPRSRPTASQKIW